MRKTSIAERISSNGDVARNPFTNAEHVLLKAFCWAFVKPSASSTTLNAHCVGHCQIWWSGSRRRQRYPWLVPLSVLICRGNVAISVTPRAPASGMAAGLSGVTRRQDRVRLALPDMAGFLRCLDDHSESTTRPRRSDRTIGSPCFSGKLPHWRRTHRGLAYGRGCDR